MKENAPRIDWHRDVSVEAQHNEVKGVKQAEMEIDRVERMIETRPDSVHYHVLKNPDGGMTNVEFTPEHIDTIKRTIARLKGEGTIFER